MPHNLYDLCKYRYEQGKAALESSKTLFEKSDLKGSLNRSYYAIFYAARALLALRQLETRKHSGLVATFIKVPALIYATTNIPDDLVIDPGFFESLL
jgi:uncharacterized protein (UPF0332 family)